MSEKVTLYHNPRCSKSRQALQLLRERGIEPQIIEYLKDPPSSAELNTVLRQLGMQPRQLMRRGESLYRNLGLDNSELTSDQLIDAMAANPVLIERPIVRTGGRAALGRPPENVLSILRDL